MRICMEDTRNLEKRGREKEKEKRRKRKKKKIEIINKNDLYIIQ